MKEVWILEQDIYEGAHIVGVYENPTDAMVDYPAGNWTWDKDGYWFNGLDWNEHRVLRRYVVKESQSVVS